MTLREHLDLIIAEHGLKQWSRVAQKDEAFMALIPVVEGLSFPERVLVALGEPAWCERGQRRKFGSIVTGWRFCGKTGVCPCAAETVSRKCKTNIDHEARLAKTSATLKARYGSTNPGQAPAAKAAHRALYEDEERVAAAVAKGRATMLERHGVDNAFKLPIDRKAIARREWSIETGALLDDPALFADYMASRSSMGAADDLGINPTTINNYVRRHGLDLRGSSYEREIASFLADNGLNFKPRDRTVIRPLELDFLLTQHDLAIEFNGLYYHSELVLDNDAHQRKWQMCHDAGIRLLMINEDEWNERKEVLKRKILILCGLGERGVGGRQLSVRDIGAPVARAFCEQHHIQGAPGPVTLALGAFEGDDLRGVVTMGSQRGTGATELTRFCTDGRLYAGMFGKLLKAAQHRFDEIVTFADLRYSDGGVYDKTGFINCGTIRPDYRYVIRNKSFHKSLFTKKRIAERFNIDMTGLTERDAMRSLGIPRIYDCGKIKYRWLKD
jgi:hypothetical protein